jgi:urease accessory protein
MRSLTAAIAALATALATAPAAAHPGHGLEGLAAGFAHPFGGIDHLLAMIAVGAWAAQQGGRAVWALPAAFVVTMTLGGAAALAGLGMAGTESFIIASVLVLGAVIAAVIRPPLWLAVPLVAAFAFSHGLAHGSEMPNAEAAAPYVAGFIASTALLHAAGIALALALRGAKPRFALRFAGAAQIGAGVLLAAGAF